MNDAELAKIEHGADHSEDLSLACATKQVCAAYAKLKQQNENCGKAIGNYMGLTGKLWAALNECYTPQVRAAMTPRQRAMADKAMQAYKDFDAMAD